MKGAVLLVLLATLSVCAQQAEPPKVCGDGRTVDDYVRDLAPSKNKRRKNPLPDTVCILGWCKEMPKASEPQGPFPNPPEVRSDTRPMPEPARVEGASSSKQSKISDDTLSNIEARYEPCNVDEAARDVYVGDIYFSDKKYKQALNRYRLALENWPREPAIHYRLGRAYEAMKDSAQAAEQYQSAIDAAPESPLANEARALLTRVEKSAPPKAK
jgi:tetratricopeptide (TPR) repeat protein